MVGVASIDGNARVCNLKLTPLMSVTVLHLAEPAAELCQAAKDNDVDKLEQYLAHGRLVGVLPNAGGGLPTWSYPPPALTKGRQSA